MNKDTDDFKDNYKRALFRIGLGIHVIKQLTAQGVIEPHNTDYHIKMWAKVLADGVDMQVDTVITDATKTCNSFSPSYLAETNTQRMIAILMPLMAEAGALPRHS